MDDICVLPPCSSKRAVIFSLASCSRRSSSTSSASSTGAGGAGVAVRTRGADPTVAAMTSSSTRLRASAEINDLAFVPSYVAIMPHWMQAVLIWIIGNPHCGQHLHEKSSNPHERAISLKKTSSIAIVRDCLFSFFIASLNPSEYPDFCTPIQPVMRNDSARTSA